MRAVYIFTFTFFRYKFPAMVGSTQEHRANIGYFAAKLCSCDWKLRSTGRARLGYEQKPKKFPFSGVLKSLLLILKLIIVVSPVLQLHNTPVSSEARSIKNLSPRLLDQDFLRPISSILGYDPLANISLDQEKLVFLSQELTTSGMVTILLDTPGSKVSSCQF